jgi:hypothetical protein
MVLRHSELEDARVFSLVALSQTYLALAHLEGRDVSYDMDSLIAEIHREGREGLTKKFL